MCRISSLEISTLAIARLPRSVLSLLLTCSTTHCRHARWPRLVLCRAHLTSLDGTLSVFWESSSQNRRRKAIGPSPRRSPAKIASFSRVFLLWDSARRRLRHDMSCCLRVALEFLAVDVQLSIGSPLKERLRLRVQRLEPRPAGSYQAR